MRIRSFVFPSLLLALALLVSNQTLAGYPGTSLVQPAIAFSDISGEVPVEDQIHLIQVVDNNIILSSAWSESEEALMEDDELGNGSFVNASPVPAEAFYQTTPFHCEACGPSACGCSSCVGSDDTNGRIPSCFDRFALSSKRRSQFFMNTWLSAGATLPSRSPNYEVEALSRFPDAYEKFLVNQLYFTVGRDVNKQGNFFDIGGRLDLLYGTDYYFTSAFGLETKTTSKYDHWTMDPKTADAKWNSSNGPRNAWQASLYGLSMPQLYGEFFAPLGLGTTVKAGHFYSVMGYESPMSPENFFYSHTWSMTHGSPMTFTGVVVNQQLTRRLTGLVGYTNGWDIWDNPRGTASIITGFQWSSLDRSSELAFTIHTGNDRRANLNSPIKDGDRTNYSLVYSRQLTPRWKWAIQHDLGFEKNVNRVFNNIDFSNDFVDGQWASIVNYLYYTINDKWSAGGRFEWFQDIHNSRIGNLYPYQSWNTDPIDNQWTSGQNYYNFTLGLNWKPVPRMTLRPEIRWDWSDVERHVNGQSRGMFSDFRSNHLFTVALEGYIKF